ncbi:MAG: caspase family protein [Alphaproteobacteria bacterium]|nr:caspase family protein [Alphaproteobacteria bacterium]
MGAITILVAGVLSLLSFSPVSAQTEKRVVPVIGNAAYPENPLKNPVNDARAMASVLKQTGFQVIVRENATKQDMERAVGEFGRALQPGAVALFYYAGHGVQVNGRNFLIPVDASIESEHSVRLETLDVDLVLDQIASRGSDVNVVILDACRNNPFERRFRSRGGGLAQIDAPKGTLIAYATAPGRTALDGAGDDGGFVLVGKGLYDSGSGYRLYYYGSVAGALLTAAGRSGSRDCTLDLVRVTAAGAATPPKP